jgi:hypothetical protein
MRGVAQLDADCRIKPGRAAAKTSDFHANATITTTITMALGGYYFKLKCSNVKALLQRSPARRRRAFQPRFGCVL